jgi:succinoglycan biosynthesis transport protein ExoP
MAELNSALIQTRSQVAEAQARWERVNDIIRAASSDPNKLATATVTDTLNNAVITRLRQQFLDMAAREHDWSARYGSQHLAAVNLRYQMREIRQSIGDELQRIAETYKSDYEIAKSREGSIEKTLSEIVSQSQQTNQAQIILHDLDSAAQAYRALYDNFLQRYMESVQQQSFPITEARLITHAARPLKNSHPKVLLVAAISLAGGLMLAFGAAQLRDLSDRVVRTTSQVEAALQANCIAVLPIVQGRIDPSRWSFADKVDESGTRTIARDDWSVMDDPFSRFAEGIRSIKVASDQIETRKSTKVIGVTSSVPKEGKSTVATALAQIIAYGGSRAILVDCDLRNPSLSRGLTPNAKSGLLEVISGRARLEDVIWTDPRTKLSVLPIVAKARLAHTSDILGSPPTKMLFDSLRERYDYVVVDLSPLAPVVDVRTTIKLVDSYLFVVEWGRTKIDVAEHALAVSRGVYDGLLGVVLNKVNINVLRRYEHNRGTYYAQYDYTEGSGVRVPSSSRRSAA